MKRVWDPRAIFGGALCFCYCCHGHLFLQIVPFDIFPYMAGARTPETKSMRKLQKKTEGPL